MRIKTKVLGALAIWLLATLAACGGGTSSNSPAAPTGLSYQAVGPIDVGASINWPATVTGTVSQYAVSPALPAGLALDPATGVITGTPVSATASASYVVTATNPGGSATFTLAFAVQTPPVGPTGEVKVGGTSETQVIALSSSTPTSGETVIVNVSVPGASRIDLAFAGSGCGALVPIGQAGATLTQSGVVAASGQCQLTASASGAGGNLTYSSEFTVMPSAKLPAQGLTLVNGTYFSSGDAALLATSPLVAAGAVNVPQALVNGGSASLYVAQTGSSVAARAIVQISQVPGYYIVPLVLDAASGSYRIDIQASPNFLDQISAPAATTVRTLAASRADSIVRNLPPATEPKSGASSHALDVHKAAVTGTTLTVTVSLVGPDGGVSAPASADLPVQTVGSGPIQVSLSWAGATDVDLHVTPPNSADIYYGNRSDSTGGTLDLDSNAGCSIDNVNNENIVWANTAAPDTGTYEVRVDYWSNCGNSTPIPYTVRITNCGVSTSYNGTLAAGQADRGGAGSGFVVATINYQSCSGISVAGTARFDDYQPTTSGLSSTARSLPIRYAQVEVHQSSDDSVLATGQTDENGGYSLTFSMATPGKYYVKVLAAQSLEWLSQKVVNSSGAIYAIRTTEQDAAVAANATGVDLNAKRDASFAEAFNMFDLGVSAFKEVQARLGATLPTLTWRWTAGQATCGGAASCYEQSDNSIYVLSTAADADEYDDAVLAHEFGHFVMRQVSRDDSPGGTHQLDQQNVPTLAWSEGVATFIGQRLMQTPTYIDTNSSSSGAFTYNVESLPSYVPSGTSDGTLSGNLSEALVTAVLWDLADTGQDSKSIGGTVYVDKVSNPDAAYSVLKSWHDKTHDRGATGADLVDFIDEWLCTIPSTTWETTAGNNFNGLITKVNGFPYSPNATPNCQ